jgi:[acyl-carrier-protein] S-malonyltransferase
VVAANYNAANQIAISGSLDGVKAASALASEAGAKRVIALAVGGAFHSPLMRPSPEQLTPVLDSLLFHEARTPVILNVTAQPTTDPAEIKNRLIEQLTSPVMWYPTMQRMSEMGITRAVELGPKKVLCGLAKGALAGAALESLDTVADFENAWGQPSPVPQA